MPMDSVTSSQQDNIAYIDAFEINSEMYCGQFIANSIHTH